MHYRFFRDSFVGRMVYHLSKHKYFSHKEESPDYIVPEKYLSEFKQLPRSESNQENFDKDKESDLENASNSTATGDVDDGKIIVTWDGDDDPENPLNWPFYQKAFLFSKFHS